MSDDDNWYYDEDDSFGKVDGFDDFEDDLDDFTIYDNEEDMQKGTPSEVITSKVKTEEDSGDEDLVTPEDTSEEASE